MMVEADIPDYSRCTLEDLYDVRRRMDAARFPTRAAAVEAEIALREAGGGPQRSQGDLEKHWKARWFRDPRTLGIYMVVSGGWALALVHDSGVVTGQGSTVLWLAIPLVTYGLLLIAGAMAALKLPGWLWTGAVAWAIQVPVIRADRVAYSVFSPPAMEVKLWPEVGFAAAFAPQLSVSLFPVSQPFYLGVNAIALSAAAFLVDRLLRRSAARRRQDVRPSVSGANAG